MKQTTIKAIEKASQEVWNDICKLTELENPTFLECNEIKNLLSLCMELKIQIEEIEPYKR